MAVSLVSPKTSSNVFGPTAFRTLNKVLEGPGNFGLRTIYEVGNNND